MGHCESTTPVDTQTTPVDRRTLTGGVMIKLYSGELNQQQYMLKIKKSKLREKYDLVM